MHGKCRVYIHNMGIKEGVFCWKNSDIQDHDSKKKRPRQLQNFLLKNFATAYTAVAVKPKIVNFTGISSKTFYTWQFFAFSQNSSIFFPLRTSLKEDLTTELPWPYKNFTYSKKIPEMSPKFRPNPGQFSLWPFASLQKFNGPPG